MSRASEWLKDDLSKMNRPSTIVRTVRRHPLILVRALLRLVAALGVIAVVLALFGHLEVFSDWYWLAAIDAGLAGGRDISRHKTTDGQGLADVKAARAHE